MLRSHFVYNLKQNGCQNGRQTVMATKMAMEHLHSMKYENNILNCDILIHYLCTTTLYKCVRTCLEAMLVTSHYENLPMQYTETFKALKNENFQLKNFDIFLIFPQNIDCGRNLCFGAKIRQVGIPLHTPVLLYKSGV